MAQWNWLTQPDRPYTWGFALRVVVKAAVLFIILNIVFALVDPLPALGGVSVYNGLVPGRERLPYGENPAQSYNLSLDSLEAMFASHAVARPKSDDEFRVVLIGDSATWGFLLQPGDTLAGLLDAEGLITDDGRQLRFYNLGYPIMSLTKDLMLLDYAMQLEPDLIIWPLTLESFPPSKQLFPPIIQHNPDVVRPLIEAYDLNLDATDERFAAPNFLARTIVGQRRELADWLRLQLYGFAWATTGIDQFYPESYTARQEDFEEDVSFQEFAEPQTLTPDDLAFDVLSAGVARAGDVPVLLINEPMFISDGDNSDLRYNFFYPRWAYDAFRDLLHELAEENDWYLLDLWDGITQTEFTDSAVHFTPEGARQYRDLVAPAVLSLVNEGRLPQ